jgi:uncharacterized ferredoxin-like protein
MAVIKEEEIRQNGIKDIAVRMMTAARTAPKAKGRDNLEILYIDGEEMDRMAGKMEEISQRMEIPFFSRDAGNVKDSSGMVLIGTRIKTGGLKYCGLCGFENCTEKEQHPDVPCIFNTNDLGIAVGSAVATAADNRVDNRIMYTAGMAALELKIFSPEVKVVFGIPLSVTGKSPFFDRK